MEEALARALGVGGEAATSPEILALVFATEWLRVVDHLALEAADPLEQVREGVTAAWWR